MKISRKSPHVQLLTGEFELRRVRNASYSLRAFARDLQISPSLLSDVLAGKKGISSLRASKIAKCLNLNESDRNVFLLSSTAFHSRSAASRTQAKEDLRQLTSRAQNSQKMTDREFSLANNWYHMALLELTELEDCQHTPSWFATRLGLPTGMIETALKRLINLGWLRFDGCRYSPSSTESETDQELPSIARKRFHVEVIQKSEEVLLSTESAEREYLTSTLSFRKDQMEEAKRMIRKFRQDFSENFSKTKTKDSIYQINIQFFRLDKGEETK